jgi:carbonic anhydrase
MNRRRALKALTGLVLCPLCASRGFTAEGAHWTYDGTTGPDNWGDVDAASNVCDTTLLRNRRVAAAYRSHTGRRRGHRGFAKLYAMNARPAQKANRRAVLRSG